MFNPAKKTIITIMLNPNLKSAKIVYSDVVDCRETLRGTGSMVIENHCSGKK